MKNRVVWGALALSLSVSSIDVWANGASKPNENNVPLAPKSSGQKTVTKTIVITRPGTYDFKGVLHIWKGRNWNCNAGRENGPQILRIEADDVIIKNFHFVGDGNTHGSNGLGDPIHIASCGTGQGNTCKGRGPSRVTLDGIVGHACEDLLTIGTPGSDSITIRNSYFRATPSKSAWDKTIQINFGTRIKILNNTFVGGARCVRFKPRTQGEVLNNKFYNCETAILASSNDADISPMKNGSTRVRVKGNKFYNVKRETQKKGSEVRFE